jgi:uncharacterized protein YcbK (DUF882 family)
MGDISKDFSRWEFACKCNCGFDAVDVELIEVLQKLRDYYSRKITITSGCRCFSYNHKIGSQNTSQHVRAKAADIIVLGIWPITIYHTLDTFYPERYGLGLYDDFVHIDVRRNKKRWGI